MRFALLSCVYFCVLSTPCKVSRRGDNVGRPQLSAFAFPMKVRASRWLAPSLSFECLKDGRLTESPLQLAAPSASSVVNCPSATSQTPATPARTACQRPLPSPAFPPVLARARHRIGQRPHRRRRMRRSHILLRLVVRVSITGQLWQMRHAEHLMRPRQTPQLLPDDCAQPPADALVDLVKYQYRRLVGCCQDALQRQHDARRLAARGHLRQRTQRLARVDAEQKLDIIHALAVKFVTRVADIAAGGMLGLRQQHIKSARAPCAGQPVRATTAALNCWLACARAPLSSAAERANFAQQPALPARIMSPAVRRSGRCPPVRLAPAAHRPGFRARCRRDAAAAGT